MRTYDVATITTAGNVTYTTEQVTGGMILRDPNGASRVDTTPTAADIVAHLTGMAVGGGFPCIIRNTSDSAGTENITLAPGTGVTMSPSSVVFARTRTQGLLFVLTNVSAGAEAVTVYSLYDTTH